MRIQSPVIPRQQAGVRHQRRMKNGAVMLSGTTRSGVQSKHLPPQRYVAFSDGNGWSKMNPLQIALQALWKL